MEGADARRQGGREGPGATVAGRRASADLAGPVSSLDGKQWILLAVAGAAAALFSSLGLWQLDRHAQREARNDTLRARLAAAPVDVSSSALAADSLAWRPVRLEGRFDYRREIVLRGRAHEGTPGVYVVTPLRRPDGAAVLVVRGWLPAADGLHAPLSRGRPDGEAGTVRVRGVLLPSVPGGRASVSRDSVDGASHLVASRMDVGALADSLPYPVAPLYAQRIGDGGRRGDGELPALLAAPAPDPGPHLWYALQWFGFAVIALAGTGAYLWTDLREEPELGRDRPAVDPGRARPEAER